MVMHIAEYQAIFRAANRGHNPLIAIQIALAGNASAGWVEHFRELLAHSVNSAEIFLTPRVSVSLSRGHEQLPFSIPYRVSETRFPVCRCGRSHPPCRATCRRACRATGEHPPLATANRPEEKSPRTEALCYLSTAVMPCGGDAAPGRQGPGQAGRACQAEEPA